MKVNINSATAEKRIKTALEAVQGRCKVRTIDFDDIQRTLESVEKKIGIPKCWLDGCTLSIDINAQNFPLSYKYIPESTIFWAENKKGSWYITNICRSNCRRANDMVRMILTEDAKREILCRFNKFSI